MIDKFKIIFLFALCDRKIVQLANIINLFKNKTTTEY